MSEIKLKPCPFCGGQAILLQVASNLYAVTCKDVNCAAAGGVMTSEIDAAEVWNRRADNPNTKSCITCRHYTSLPDYRDGKMGTCDFWKPITGDCLCVNQFRTGCEHYDKNGN